jgi:hypothetical protein
MACKKLSLAKISCFMRISTDIEWQCENDDGPAFDRTPLKRAMADVAAGEGRRTRETMAARSQLESNPERTIQQLQSKFNPVAVADPPER